MTQISQDAYLGRRKCRRSFALRFAHIGGGAASVAVGVVLGLFAIGAAVAERPENE